MAGLGGPAAVGAVTVGGVVAGLVHCQSNVCPVVLLGHKVSVKPML